MGTLQGPTKLGDIPTDLLKFDKDKASKRGKSYFGAAIPKREQGMPEIKQGKFHTFPKGESSTNQKFPAPKSLEDAAYGTMYTTPALHVGHKDMDHDTPSSRRRNRGGRH